MLFIIKETFRSIGRTKISFSFAFISTTISIFLIQLTFYSVHFSEYYESEIKKNFFVNIFLLENIDLNKQKQILSEINSTGYVEKSFYISKDEAKKKFIKETGEDFSKILKNNPLPASFVVTLSPSTLDNRNIKTVLDKFEEIQGVESVFFESDLYNRALKLINTSQKYLWIMVGIFTFLAFYILYSTLRLILENQAEEILTMKLVGASTMMISAPIILSGIFIGLLGALFSNISLFVIQGLTNKLISFTLLPKSLSMSYLFYSSFIVGPIMGLICSTFVTRNIKISHHQI
ncbi:MAG: permease-like cell division protein FtsX [Ignavibacteria bacterium]|nr:permease-like cell division protein FtsX [Ignavibacteria bacterium]